MDRLTLLLAGAALASAHMSPFLSSMYGGPLDYPDLQNPVTPLGPGLEFDDWWFRGPQVRNAPPKSGAIALLPAGGTFTLEIACAPEYTTYDGNDGTGNVACDDPGPYHADPEALTVIPDLIAGCAIGIADVMDPNDATMDDFTIISVQSQCISHRDTTFSIPAQMPPCTGDWCICGWVWSPQTGISNAYHTPFRCKITGSPADAKPIAPPQDPVYCPDSRDDCTKGAKKLISSYNYPVNVPFTSNADRPGYHDTFGFFDGAQDDIFLQAPASASSTSIVHTASTSTTSSSGSSAASPKASSTIETIHRTRSSTTPVQSSTSKTVWTLVPTTTPRRASAEPTAVSQSSRPSSSLRRVPLRDRTTTTTSAPSTESHRVPFASRLSLLPSTTIAPASSATTTRAARRTFKERQEELEVSFVKKAVSHPSTSVKRRRSFGAADTALNLGMADRLVERMKKVVSRERREETPPAEKLVWTRVEL